MIRPDIAIFGEKDWQQLAVIRRMVRDLKISIKLVEHPTVREEDGLALSSRNRLLLPESRLAAPRIYQALLASAMEAEAGEASVSRLRQGLKKDLAAIPGAEIDYVEIVDESILTPLKKLTPQVKARALVAVRFGSLGTGSVRLLDNISLPFRS
jgi:pantoate--beta-alanine ligase